MNKERRQEVQDVADILDDAISRLQEIIYDEQDAYDNLSEGLQYSRTGESMEEAIQTLEGFEDDIQKLSDCISKYATPPKKKK